MSAKYFCANCGSIVEQGIKFCANCGTAVNAKQAPQQTPPQAAPAAQAYTPAQPYTPTQTVNVNVGYAPGAAVSPHNRTVTLLLCIFLGGIGIHKFYVGKTGEGIAYFLLAWTGIPAFIAFIEIFVIAAGSFKDDRNLPVLTW